MFCSWRLRTTQLGSWKKHRKMPALKCAKIKKNANSFQRHSTCFIAQASRKESEIKMFHQAAISTWTNHVLMEVFKAFPGWPNSPPSLVSARDADRAVDGAGRLGPNASG